MCGEALVNLPRQENGIAVVHARRPDSVRPALFRWVVRKGRLSPSSLCDDLTAKNHHPFYTLGQTGQPVNTNYLMKS
jgi:hypothetical protein